MVVDAAQWLCCLLGARDHYALPVALNRMGLLGGVITDIWVGTGSPLAALSPRLADRTHPDLPAEKVVSWNLATIAYEALHRSTGRMGSITDSGVADATMRRNQWFQRRAVRALDGPDFRFRFSGKTPPILFAYSYAALDLLRIARARGWRTVLGQIDAGVAMESLAARLGSEGAWPQACSERRPPAYWELWREECALADRIVVNSRWAQTCLVEAGVESSKIKVVPLVVEPTGIACEPKEYPAQFTRTRPLRALFVGQVTPLKGVVALLDAVMRLPPALVELTVVGATRSPIPQRYAKLNNVHWIGPVPRTRVGEYYARADVLVFPTLCDGFGLVQLEAQAWKVPVIASRFCGEVVRHNENGIVLDAVTPETIGSALQRCLGDAGLLASMSRESDMHGQLGLAEFGNAMVAAAE